MFHQISARGPLQLRVDFACRLGCADWPPAHVRMSPDSTHWTAQTALRHVETKLVTVEPIAWLDSSIVNMTSWAFSDLSARSLVFALEPGCWCGCKMSMGALESGCLCLQGAGYGLEPAGWCPCKVPQGMPLSKMLMELWSRKQKFRFQISKSSRECDSVG